MALEPSQNDQNNLTNPNHDSETNPSIQIPAKEYRGMWTHGHEGSYERCNEQGIHFFKELLSLVIIRTFPPSLDIFYLSLDIFDLVYPSPS